MNNEYERRHGSSNQTGRVACGALHVRGRLTGEDLAQPVDVDLAEHAAPAGALEPSNVLGTEDVDLAVEDPAPVAHVALFCLELVLQLLQLLVREGAEIRERFHRSLAFPVDRRGFKRTRPRTVNLNLRIQAPDFRPWPRSP